MFSWLKNLFTIKPKLSGVEKVFSDWSIVSYEDLLEHFDVKAIAKEMGEKT